MLPRRATAPLQLGPYQLVERLAQGGMAAVYKAKLNGPSGFEKTVVVKAMLPALAAHDELVELFCAEARLSAQLNHPNIVQVLDFGVADGTPYLVMEFLDGWTLAQLRDRLAGPRKGRFPVGAAVKVARDVCLALGYAHNFVDREGQRRQIIHRDVSPSNVMLCRDGSVKLLDFGIARVVSPSGSDVTTSFRGKYAYMAPEQVRRLPLDRRVDVFATGTVLHEMLTGKRLFASVSELETLERVAAAQVTAPSGENSEVPRALDLIVKKALAREPNGRYTSGAAMAEALDTLDAVIYSRRNLAKLLKQLFPEAFTVTCEVCGKQVLPGRECDECGTTAVVDDHSVSEPPRSSECVADAEPLPPPPAMLPRVRREKPPHLFVVPKLPSRDDDSVKMGLGRSSSSVVTVVESRTRAPEPEPAIPSAPHLVPLAELHTTPPADLRGLGRGGRAAMALMCVGVIGIGATLLWKGPAPPLPSAKASAPKIVVTAPVVVAAPAPVVERAAPPVKASEHRVIAPTKKLVIVKKPHHRAAVAQAALPSVRDGRLVDPFAGSD